MKEKTGSSSDLPDDSGGAFDPNAILRTFAERLRERDKPVDLSISQATLSANSRVKRPLPTSTRRPGERGGGSASSVSPRHGTSSGRWDMSDISDVEDVAERRLALSAAPEPQPQPVLESLAQRVPELAAQKAKAAQARPHASKADKLAERRKAAHDKACAAKRLASDPSKRAVAKKFEQQSKQALKQQPPLQAKRAARALAEIAAPLLCIDMPKFRPKLAQKTDAPDLDLSSLGLSRLARQTSPAAAPELDLSGLAARTQPQAKPAPDLQDFRALLTQVSQVRHQAAASIQPLQPHEAPSSTGPGADWLASDALRDALQAQRQPLEAQSPLDLASLSAISALARKGGGGSRAS